MDGNFEPSDPYNGHSNNAYNQHSQSSNMNAMGMGYSSNMAPPSFQQSHSSLQVPRYPNNPINSYHSYAHDDTCVEQCAGVGLFYGSQQFNHRGPQPGLPDLMTGGRGVTSAHTQADLFQFHLHQMPASASHFNSSQIRPNMSLSQEPFQQNPYQIYDSWPEHSEADHSTQACEDDCDSESCCDKECTMTGKCSNIGCDTADACTDQNCPDAPLAPEVVVGAAALLEITQQPDQPNTFDMAGLDFSFNGQSNYDVWNQVMNPVASHLMVAHKDPDSSTCMRPCLLDDPRNFPSCPMPLPNNNNNAGQFGNQYGSSNSFAHYDHQVVKCGAELHDPQTYLEHFNQEHRQFFAASAQNTLSNGNHGMLQNYPMWSSMEPSSSSPDTAIGSPESGMTENTPSPLTPMSNSMEMPDIKEDGVSEDHHLSLGSDNEAHIHRCLWRDEGQTRICGVICQTPEALFAHAATSHIKVAKKGDQGFRCGWDDCPRSEVGAAGFPQRSKIERHMQTHIEYKPHVCHLCKKGFSAKQALNQHMFIHTNQKPLTCEICRKEFRYPSALTMHQRVHTGEKPLSCPICGKSFSESSNLSKHKRTHEVRGRFNCTVRGCDRNFHRQDQLRRHLKTHQRPSDAGQADVGSGLEVTLDQQLHV
ncbi:hypothetical protein OQA88_6760 [Cercophora sp. LCS_1]